MTTVETTIGRVRGRVEDGVAVFRGIPYGSARRFRRATAPPPWSGVREALEFPPMAPQVLPPKPPGFDGRSGGMDPWSHEMSEDCLALSVWTPATDSAHRPVMVWVHGGAFLGGMGDSGWSDGASLARHEDVVVVHFNHRLNAFGYLALGTIPGADEELADSANVGMLDIVLVLEWVRDNIERFGGDPDRVTIFGVSGGGWKVSTLLAMPAAHGLFHRAIVQSGSLRRAITLEEAERTTRHILGELDIPADRLDLLDHLPVQALLDATLNLGEAGAPFRGFVDGRLYWDPLLGPVVDGRTLDRHPFDPDAAPLAAGVPMMIGSNLDDGLAVRAVPQTEADLRTETIGFGLGPDAADELIAGYRRTRPGVSPADLFLAILTDVQFGMPAIIQSERAAQRTDVYRYLFAWRGRAPHGAAHSLEVPFAFDALDANLLAVPEEENARGLARIMRGAWAAFARTGDPTHPDLPEWPRYDTAHRQTMVFDRESGPVADPFAEDRAALQALLDSAPA